MTVCFQIFVRNLEKAKMHLEWLGKNKPQTFVSGQEMEKDS